jgi:hypothetical protein
MWQEVVVAYFKVLSRYLPEETEETGICLKRLKKSTIVCVCVSVPGLETREYGRRDPSRWPCGTLYPQKLALTSPVSCGRSVSIVRSRTQATELSVWPGRGSNEARTEYYVHKIPRLVKYLGLGKCWTQFRENVFWIWDDLGLASYGRGDYFEGDRNRS